MNYSYAKVPTISAANDARYSEEECSNFTTGCDDDQQSFKFDVYFPKNTIYQNYATCPLPFILIFHGGGYKECSTKESSDIKYICQLLAQRGIVAFNVEYRRGRLLAVETQTPNLLKTAQQQTAVGRAVQDVRGAIKSICKMASSGIFNSMFRIDTSKMFLGGASAGAGAVLTATYLQKSDMADEASPGVFSVLGGLDVDYYYAAPEDIMPTTKGVFSMWAEFPMPGSVNTNAEALNFFSRNHYIAPVIAFHGSSDPVATPWQREENYPTDMSETPSRTSTSQCLSSTFTVTHSDDESDLRMIGTLGLRDLVQAKNKKAEVYIDCQMAHGLDDDNSGFNSDFASGYTNQRDVMVYMVQRAAVFIQSLLIGNAIPGPSTFINCINDRYNVYNSATGTCGSNNIAQPCEDCTDCTLLTIPDCNSN